MSEHVSSACVDVQEPTSVGNSRGHTVEVAPLAAGYRVLAAPGAHAATFALASAVLAGASDVFDTVNATTMTGTRNELEYLDVDQQTEADEGDARWAVQLAGRAVEDASSFLS